MRPIHLNNGSCATVAPMFNHSCCMQERRRHRIQSQCTITRFGDYATPGVRVSEVRGERPGHGIGAVTGSCENPLMGGSDQDCELSPFKVHKISSMDPIKASMIFKRLRRLFGTTARSAHLLLHIPRPLTPKSLHLIILLFCG